MAELSPTVTADAERDDLHDRYHHLRLHDHPQTGGSVQLSPYDLANLGRAIPMVFFYEATLDPHLLLNALEKTLVLYPAFCGRYDAMPPAAISLTNAGVGVFTSTVPTTLAAAIAHLPAAGEDAAWTSFAVDAHVPYVPEKEAMDPDAGSPEAPLIALKITSFEGGGTAIGMLAQHGVVDADAQIAFVRAWSLAYRGLPVEPAPDHDRCDCLAAADAPPADAPPAGCKMVAVPRGEVRPPEFAPVMPKIKGARACAVPFSARALKALKAAASAELADGFVSTDDVLSARVWQALCAVRCEQLGLAADSDEVTTCSRATNIRKRTEPPLGAGYCANGVTQVWSELTVRELLSMRPSAVARRLRADLQALTPQAIAARTAWLRDAQQRGCATRQRFDAHALTFIVSSWNFGWEGAEFGGAPIRFEHGAFVPIVAVLVPRPNADGVDVYASGTHDAVEQFVRLVTAP